MRNRTELLTTTLADSENEDEGSIDDSEEDWKPEKVTAFSHLLPCILKID